MQSSKQNEAVLYSMNAFTLGVSLEEIQKDLLITLNVRAKIWVEQGYLSIKFEPLPTVN